MKHLIFTGFMGAGKTTIGKILASSLQMPFVDLDEAIQKKTGLMPHHYISRFGEKAFRKIEKLTLQKVLARKPSVLATGGGAVLDSQNRRLLKEKGVVVWLNPPLRALFGRLKNSSTRPLLPNPFSYDHFKTMYQRRRFFYQACHLNLRHLSQSPKELAILISQKYRDFQSPWSLYAPRPPQ